MGLIWVYFYYTNPPENITKQDFLMISGGIVIEHWIETSQSILFMNSEFPIVFIHKIK